MIARANSLLSRATAAMLKRVRLARKLAGPKSVSRIRRTSSSRASERAYSCFPYQALARFSRTWAVIWCTSP